MANVSSLTFDRQAGTALPAAEAVRAWAATQRIFVSSLITDLRAERDAVRNAVLAFGAVPVMFEDELGAQDQPADDSYLDGVRQSGIYVGIFGPRYGIRLRSGRSATHDELTEVESLGLRLCLFTSGYGSEDMEREQSDLIGGLQNRYTTSAYADPANLGTKVEARLRELASEALLPWVRIGDLLLRASTIVTNGGIVAVSASIFDRTIVARLQRMALGRFTQPDPSSHGRNTYAYVSCSPVNASDPNGRVTARGAVGSVLAIVGGVAALVGFIGLSIVTGGTAALILGAIAALGVATAPADLVFAILTLEDEC